MSLVNQGTRLSKRHESTSEARQVNFVYLLVPNYESCPSNKTKKISLKTWQASFHFINELMLQDIEMYGFIIDDVKKWKVNTAQQFSRALQQAIQSNKFKLR